MTVASVLFAAEVLLLGFGVGATIWVFFVQTPALLLGLGMERFLPLQMRLVRVFARALAVTTVATLVLALARVGLDMAVVPAAIAAAAAVANVLWVVPRALRSGGKALREVRAGEADDDAGVASFVSVGGGTPTKVWHRMVVLMVSVMAIGLIVDAVDLLHDAPEAVAHEHVGHGAEGAAPMGAAHAKHVADPVTAENMRVLHGKVGALAARGPEGSVTTDDVADLRQAFFTVFRDCTMEGPDHDALHDLLLPLDGLIDQVGEPGRAQEALAGMDAQLVRFGQDFRVGE